MNWNVFFAIFKRNFVSYFTSPTGYVFILVFVVLSSLAAFWPDEFFTSNLANLDQLSTWMPFILLVFVPAITMSLWAEERKEGTDELLLTIPASDLDVVTGKYLAAVAIFTTALIYSGFAILLIFLWRLGDPDWGLFFATYVGYWFMGIAMLAIGMVASFLTSNLTVAFILGMLFNAPFAVAGVADSVVWVRSVADWLRQWSAIEQLQDFMRGVLSLSSTTYFVMLAVVAVYLSVVLIGRRHWKTGADGNSLMGHVVARSLALVAIVLSANVVFSNQDLIRWDVTADRLTSLSPDTKRIINELANDDDIKPIVIDAYVSKRVPQEYVNKKLNLLSTLDELQSLSGGKIQVNVHILEKFSKEARTARETHGIEQRSVIFREGGKLDQDRIYMGFVARCRLQKKVIRFIEPGIPVEYELVRTIATVAQEKKKRLGVVRTEVPLLSGEMTFPGQPPQQKSEVVEELEKQYEIVEIDPAEEITQQVDVMLVVQPSSLAPDAMTHLVDAVQSGIPTVVLEDPLPIMFGVPGTASASRGPGGQPMPRGDIGQLFKALGVELEYGGTSIITQDYNPEKKAQMHVTPEFIFIDPNNGAFEPFNDEISISDGMRQVLFLYSGAIRKARAGKLAFDALATTGDSTGSVSVMLANQLMQMLQSGRMATSQFEQQMESARTGEEKEFRIAAYVHGKRPLDDVSLSEVSATATGEQGEGEGENPQDGSDAAESPDANNAVGDDRPEIRAIVVADIDWIAPAIFQLRAVGDNPDYEVNWKFQNVVFLLNMLDFLADEDRFIEMRKRERQHRPLSRFEQYTSEVADEMQREEETHVTEIQDEIKKANDEFNQELDEKREQWQGLSARDRENQVRAFEINARAKLRSRIRTLEESRDDGMEEIRENHYVDIRSKQNTVKLAATTVPCIPPLLLGIFVYFHRRKGEQEGVAKTRLR